MPSPSSIMDPAADKNQTELVKIANRFELPDFVKEAAISPSMDPVGSGLQIAVTAYADPVRKKFACHSAAATWLSAAYFHDKSAEYHPNDRRRVCERFEHFADFFGMRPAYDEIVKKAELLRGSDQLPDSSYAYVWEADNGSKERFYPLTSSAEVKVAAEWLHASRDRIPFAERHTVSKKILEKAARYGAGLGDDLTDFIEKQAGRGIPNPASLYKMLENRAVLADSEAHREAIMKVAAAVKATPRQALQQNELIKLASLVDVVDHSLGLIGKYTDMLPRPEDIIFEVTFTKAASDFSQLCTLQTGNIYGKDQLSKLARDSVVSVFGEDFADAVCTGFDVDPEKVADVAHTLPRPDAELLERLLAEAGQHPQMGKTAGVLDDASLEAMAAAYKR